MSGIKAITLVVGEPGAVPERLADAFGWTATADHESVAEVDCHGGPTLWLNAPSEATSLVQQGIVLHYWVDDVPAATERARAAGATILREPTRMDFGMESAMAQVDGGPIIDLTRPIAD